MNLRCPQCKTEVAVKDLPAPCPYCGDKVYFYDKWRWLRGITCGFIALLPMFLWYHFDGTLTLLIRWLVFVWIAWFVLFFFVSYRLFPPELRLAPQDGPLRLNL